MPDASGGKTGGPDFHEEMDRFAGHMPGWAGRNLKRLRHPRAVWVRVPAGVALTGGGVLSVLPGLGLWMVPVGLALLAHDVPLMRRPLARVLRFTNVKIEARRMRRRNAASKPASAAGRRAVLRKETKSRIRTASKTASRTAHKPPAKRATRKAAETASRTANKAASGTTSRTAAKSSRKGASGRNAKA